MTTDPPDDDQDSPDPPDSANGVGEDPEPPDGPFEEGTPMVPPPHVKAELEDYLRKDTTRLGKVFVLLEEGKSDEEICAEAGISTGDLRRFKWLIDSILDGVLTTERWLAERNAGRFRSILRNPGLSDDARDVLSHNLQILENRASKANGASVEGMVPPPHVRAELEDFLGQDDSRFGQVYRLDREGKTPEEIAEELGVATPGFVYSNKGMISALLYGRLPTAPSSAKQTARKFRSIRKEWDWSDDADDVLSHNLQILENRASDTARREAETVAAKRATSKAEALGKPGIYVYTLPHYYWYPYDPDSGRTLYKVGRSDRKVIKRFREQTRTTALPEDPILPRVYPVEDSGCSKWIEQRFHALLKTAGHERSTARTGGTEWFLTSLEFLDEIAVTLKLEIIEVDNPEDDLEDDE